MFTNPRVSNKMDGSQDVKKGITIWEGERGWQVPYDNDRLCVCVCVGGGGFYGVDSVFLLSRMFATDHKFLRKFQRRFFTNSNAFFININI